MILVRSQTWTNSRQTELTLLLLWGFGLRLVPRSFPHTPGSSAGSAVGLCVPESSWHRGATPGPGPNLALLQDLSSQLWYWWTPDTHEFFFFFGLLLLINVRCFVGRFSGHILLFALTVMIRGHFGLKSDTFYCPLNSFHRGHRLCQDVQKRKNKGLVTGREQ